VPAVLLVLVFNGCAQTSPPLSPGTSSLRVTVLAQPKSTRAAANNHVLVYDVQPGFGYAADGGTFGAQQQPPQNDYAKVDYTSLDDVVIWLEPVDRNAATASPAPPPPITVDVDPTKAVDPDDLSAAVAVGQHVVFHNRGSRAGSVYSVSDGNEFHLGTVPPDGRGEYVARSPGLIEVVTTSLTDPIATLYAAPTPWVRRVHGGQTITFNDLPPGRYCIVSWHPRLPGHEATVNLTADRTTDASIIVGVHGLPKVQD
jgi:hypothetical protein